MIKKGSSDGSRRSRKRQEADSQFDADADPKEEGRAWRPMVVRQLEELPRAEKPVTTAAPSMASKIRRAIWSIAWLILYRATPVPLHGWRCIVLRLFGGRIEKGARPYPSARIWAPWNLTMERNSCIAADVDCYSVAPIVLGRDCIVSQKAYLCTAGHDFRDRAFPLTTAAIRVEEGAWVAAAALVGPGVTIGRRAVVGAGAVVTRTVPAELVVVGNPARIVGRRSARNISKSTAAP